MLTIRLARVGKKNRAQFQIVVQEHTIAPGGRHVEVLGSYDPHSKVTSLKEEKAKYWIEKGAQPSDTAYNLLVSKGIISGEKRKVKLPAKKVEEVKEETKSEAPKEKEAVKEEIKAETAPEETPKEEVKAEESKPEESKTEAVDKTEEKA